MAKAEPGIIIGPCSACRFWQQGADALFWDAPSGIGQCQKVGDPIEALEDIWASGKPALVYASDPCGVLFYTREDFGCVQWERKP